MTTSQSPPATPVRTTGRFTFADWQEHPAGEGEQAPRLARASVTNAFTGGIRADGTRCEYAIAYVTETAGSFAGMQRFSGSIDGHDGTFAVEERGSFAPDGPLRCRFEVVPGSGTGALTGLRGSGEYTHRTGEESVAYTFSYGLAAPEPAEDAPAADEKAKAQE